MNTARNYLIALLFVFPVLFSCNPAAAPNSDPAASQINKSTTEATAEPTGSQPNPYFIHLSDVHLDTTAKTTDYGQDTDSRLWQNTRTKLAEILKSAPPPKFIVYTGDLPAHYYCDPSCFLPEGKRDSHNTNIKTILEDFRALAAADKIPLFYLPGNNDSLAGDYYSFADAKQQTPLTLVADPQNPFPAVNAAQSCGEAPCLLSAPHPKMGYYSARPIAGLRLIALNTIIWGKSYTAVDGTTQKAAGDEQLAWLKTQLDEAGKSGEKVYLAMHIPPGEDAYAVTHDKKETWMWAQLPTKSDSWLVQFLQLTDTHQAVISGILYGHTHLDEVRRIYSPDGTKVTEIAVSAPGITPQHSNNPGFKTVSFDSGSKEITDFITYYTTPQADVWGDKSYKFSAIYGCPANSTVFDCLSAMPLDKLNEAMDKTFTVMNGPPGYDTTSGIEVKSGR